MCWNGGMNYILKVLLIFRQGQINPTLIGNRTQIHPGSLILMNLLISLTD